MKTLYVLLGGTVFASLFFVILSASLPSFAANESGTSLASSQQWITSEQHEQIKQAIENGDYETWKTLVPENSPMAQNITAENFSLLKDLYDARKAGDAAKAKEIAGKLGIPVGKFGRGVGMMSWFGGRGGMMGGGQHCDHFDNDAEKSETKTE
ncbi:hypothetical protein HZA38_00335 [Candidatus Peregrinibacteria bacterium]|nr:hypothetical protein [Candidatus Peregrinibacteria bacterium]